MTSCLLVSQLASSNRTICYQILDTYLPRIEVLSFLVMSKTSSFSSKIRILLLLVLPRSYIYCFVAGLHVLIVSVRYSKFEDF